MKICIYMNKDILVLISCIEQHPFVNFMKIYVLLCFNLLTQLLFSIRYTNTLCSFTATTVLRILSSAKINPYTFLLLMDDQTFSQTRSSTQLSHQKSLQLHCEKICDSVSHCPGDQACFVCVKIFKNIFQIV